MYGLMIARPSAIVYIITQHQKLFQCLRTQEVMYNFQINISGDYCIKFLPGKKTLVKCENSGIKT